MGTSSTSTIPANRRVPSRHHQQQDDPTEGRNVRTRCASLELINDRAGELAPTCRSTVARRNSHVIRAIYGTSFHPPKHSCTGTQGFRTPATIRSSTGAIEADSNGGSRARHIRHHGRIPGIAEFRRKTIERPARPKNFVCRRTSTLQSRSLRSTTNDQISICRADGVGIGGRLRVRVTFNNWTVTRRSSLLHAR